MGACESFSPCSIRILVEFGILPTILKFGSKLSCELSHMGHAPSKLHLSRISPDVMFSYCFSRKGLSCLSISRLPVALLPNKVASGSPNSGSLIIASCIENDPYDFCPIPDLHMLSHCLPSESGVNPQYSEL